MIMIRCWTCADTCRLNPSEIIAEAEIATFVAAHIGCGTTATMSIDLLGEGGAKCTRHADPEATA